MDILKVIKELEEHDPRQHRETVNVTVQSLVFPHDVPCGLDEAPKLLGSR